jgi:hypothetical protein
MPRRNRVDPWGDLHAVSARGLFTGNRGCIVDAHERIVRHHRSSTLWITCLTEFRGWRVPLARPNRWTPIFFLDDAVALAAGHRPCATCRRDTYRSYRDAVDPALRAVELDRRLTTERLRRGSGIDRGRDRKTWHAALGSLPDGTVIVGVDGQARLVLADRMLAFSFSGWTRPEARSVTDVVEVLTPPTSVRALANGFTPVLHQSVEITASTAAPSASAPLRSRNCPSK